MIRAMEMMRIVIMTINSGTKR
ncbi:hypothetical protein NC651_032306 [Populus alba x Populus x berolinensis]|nr:hypothetical protein NC651_032306 [Populus alba x Populus x berolinensis]